MKLMNFLIRITTIVVVVFMFSSCDDDFNSVGAEVIGDVNFNDETFEISPVAYSKVFDRVQTNGLAGNLLGVYDDPTYGQTVYGVLSQIQPASFSPVFGDEAVLDSVVLNLPYFSENTDSEDVTVIINSNDEERTEQRRIYELDSVYGDQEMRLSIYKSNYFLKDFDPGEQDGKVYFSDDIASFGPEIENTLLYTTDQFLPSADEVVLKTEEVDDDDVTQFTRERRPPQLRLVFADDTNANELMVKNLFQSLIIDNEGNSVLSNPNNFNNFFRGIYFKAEPINGDGSLVFFDINDANFRLYYSFQKVDLQDEDDDDETDDMVSDQGTLDLNFANIIVNSIENNFTIDLPTQNTETGEENLYLKGGVGSYAVIDLFGPDADNNDIPDQLEVLRENEWLINEAYLKFYVNQNEVIPGITEPERIYIFSLESLNALIDFGFDTVDEVNAVDSANNHLGRLSRDEDENGVFYKIRITRHVNNIVNGDAENSQLGLAVSQNVNIFAIANGSTPSSEENDENIPFSSIISHEGTILYGNGDNVPDSKRLKLEIFYTEPTNN